MEIQVLPGSLTGCSSVWSECLLWEQKAESSNLFAPTMKIIDLTCFEPTYGIIFPANSGFSYTNQVGGCGCKQTAQEGVLAPLETFYENANEDPLQDFRFETYESTHVKLVNEYLKFAGLHYVLKAPSKPDVDRVLPNFFLAEAWIPVQVRDDFPKNGRGNNSILGNLGGEIGILTCH